MSEGKRPRKETDQVGLFLVGLVLLLALLLTGLILMDRSLRQGETDRAMLDATASATIIAQEVELASEHLYEVGTRGIRRLAILPTVEAGYGKSGRLTLRAVWLFDSTGLEPLDSIVWDSLVVTSASRVAIADAARHVGVSRTLHLIGLHETRPQEKGKTLLAEPVPIGTSSEGVAVAVVDGVALLAPAGWAEISGRSFLALLVDGDTVAETPHQGRLARWSEPVPIPVPGRSQWFVISAQTARSQGARAVIWTVGIAALTVVVVGLVRERRQRKRISERSAELERLSAELLRANRMKSEFLASASHELRTPLNAIVGFVDLLRDGGYGELSAKQISPVERIATSASRLRILVDQVLDIAKIAAGRLDVRMENISLRPLLANVVSELEPLIRERELTVSIDVPPELATLSTDPTHLRQILVNLLGNAVKYTSEGTIHVEARQDENGPERQNLAVTAHHRIPRMGKGEEWIAIDVQDSGIGIARSDQERIFEEFEQVRAMVGAREKDQGTGLGLPISRRLAALLGGDITVVSELGRGSTFTVWLAVRESSAAG